MESHIIVCGDDALAVRIVDELQNVGARVSTAQSPDDLAAAGTADARAVICADDDDNLNLEIALLARQANPEVRVVARLANSVLREAMAQDNGPGAVVGGEGSDRPGDVVACPGRDLRVHQGDWTAMIGTDAELAEQGIAVAKPISATRMRRSVIRRVVGAVRAFRDDLNPMFYRALAASAILLFGATLLLRFTYRHPGMDWIDALYFSTETIATVGYGDFTFLDQPTWLRLFSILLMFAGVTTTAILVAFVADVLLSRRLSYSSGRRQVRHLHDHVIVVGLGSFGIRVVSDLVDAGYDVAVIERNDGNRFLSTAARLNVPVIFGDATLRQTLESARVDHARAVAVLTQDDVVNIETGIVLHEMLGDRDVSIVLRVYDRALGAAVAQRFGFDNVRSTVDLATPWFIGAALGLQVLGTFSVGQRSFMVGGVHVDAGSDLDGTRMADLSTQTRVIAITQPGKPVRLHPRRDTTLGAGDMAYLVGPYRELLETLRKGQGDQPAELTDRARTI